MSQAKRLADAQKHVKFCLELYEMQRNAGRRFLHEHPNTATSWQMPEVVAYASKSDVETAVCDMCAYGLRAKEEHGEALAQKRSKFLKSSSEVCKRINRQCTNKKESGVPCVSSPTRLQPKLQGGVSECAAGQHRHANLLSGRAKQCQVYSREFCREVCEGIAAQKRLDGLGLRSEPIFSLEEIKALVQSRELHDDEMPPLIQDEEDELETPRARQERQGRQRKEEDKEDGTIARHNMSGAPLRPELVMKGKREEI